MKLSELQCIFTKLVAQLIGYAYLNGYGLTFGEAYRPPETAELYAKQGRGIANSLHCKRLAIDLNLFKNGEYQTNSMAHEPLGKYWETLSTNAYKCVWGGNFSHLKDGNHYEIKEVISYEEEKQEG